MSAEKAVKTEKERRPEVRQCAYLPRVDILEETGRVVLKIDMPGVGRDGADVHIEDGVLSIEGRRDVQAPEGGTLGRREYPVEVFRRRFEIGRDINGEGIKAAMKDGVMRVVLPKVKEPAGKKIRIEQGE